MEAFRKDLQPGNEISAWCYPRKEKLETAEGESIPAYWGQSIRIAGILKRNARTLRDGTAVDVMENGSQDDPVRVQDLHHILRPLRARSPAAQLRKTREPAPRQFLSRAMARHCFSHGKAGHLARRERRP